MKKLIILFIIIAVASPLFSEESTKIKEIKANLEKSKKKTAKLQFKLGYSYFMARKHKKALGAYIEAIRLDPDNPGYLHGIGITLHALGKEKKSIEYCEMAMQGYIKKYGSSDKIVGSTLKDIGLAWDSLKEYRKAISYYEKAMDIFTKTYGASHSRVARLWHKIGDAAYQLNENKKALECLEKSLEIRVKLYGTSHRDVASTWFSLGCVWVGLEKYEKAWGYIEKARAVQSKILPANHTERKRTQRLFGILKKALKK